MADLTVRFVGDTRGLNKASRDAEGIVHKFSGKVSGFGKTIAGGVFGGNLLTSGLQTFKNTLTDVFAEARESVKVGKLTDAVLKSTGQAAHVSAGQVGELANALSVKTGIDDEQIQANENLLLTFTNIRNEVGKGNDIFSQATATIQDMSVALGQDGKASAVQLGKALNNPIKGVTALTRVGVAFTDQQKKQIKAMVESGNILGAQKIILKELGTEFGGAAEAAADPMQKFGVIVKNVEETIGLKLLPVVNAAANWLGENLPGAIDATSDALRPLGDLVQKIVNWFKKHTEASKALAVAVGGALVTAVVLYTGSMVAAAAATIAATWPILAIIAGVAALSAAAYLLYQNWDSIWAKIKSSPAYPAIQVAIGLIKQQIDVLRVVIQWVADHWPAIWGAISTAVKVNATIITSALAPVISALDRLASLAQTALHWVDKIPGVKPGEDWNAPGNPGNPQGGLTGRGSFPGAASGGVFKGPLSGYPVMLHGHEAVVPLGGRSRGSSGGVTVNVSIVNPTGNGGEIAKQLTHALTNGQGKFELKRALGVS